MKINLISVAPDYFASSLATSIVGRAISKGQVQVEIVSLRDFADGKVKKQVDDAPYGGGAGMILKIEPIDRALASLTARGERGQVYLTSARGEMFTQNHARQWAKLPILTLICGHYEGVDERVTKLIDGEISLGQFVLTGGEAAAAAMMDATIRLLPGVLGNSESLREESFNDQHLEYPQYTRPAQWRGWQVPQILLSGHHAEINKWRQAQRREIKDSQAK